MAKNRFRRKRPRFQWEGSLLGGLLERLWRLVLIVGVLAAVGWGIWWSTHFLRKSTHFEAVDLAVNGNVHLSELEIRDWLGIGGSENVLSFDADRALARLLEHPWVLQGTIKVTPPNRIEVNVTEYQPEGVLVLDKLYLIDAVGWRFAQVEPKDLVPPPEQGQPGPKRPTDLAKLPVLMGLSPQDFELSKAASEALVQEGLVLARRYQRHPLSKTHPLASVHLGVGERYELQLGSTRVVLGFDGSVARLDALARVLESLKARSVQAEYILLAEDLQRAVVKESLVLGGEAP